jgi:hypothetical protein
MDRAGDHDVLAERRTNHESNGAVIGGIGKTTFADELTRSEKLSIR